MLAADPSRLALKHGEHIRTTAVLDSHDQEVARMQRMLRCAGKRIKAFKAARRIAKPARTTSAPASSPPNALMSGKFLPV
jgi:hypothetical protein